jgi:cysteine desulfurase
MDVPAEWLQGAVRFSLSRFTTEEEVDYVNQTVPSIVKRLEGLSALGKLGGPDRRQGARPNIGARG